MYRIVAKKFFQFVQELLIFQKLSGISGANGSGTIFFQRWNQMLTNRIYPILCPSPQHGNPG